jgi:hypothetical protein
MAASAWLRHNSPFPRDPNHPVVSEKGDYSGMSTQFTTGPLPTRAEKRKAIITAAMDIVM